MTTETVTLAQIVDARKVLAAVEAEARRGKRSMAAVRVLHGVLDEETLRLAARMSAGPTLTYTNVPPSPTFIRWAGTL